MTTNCVTNQRAIFLYLYVATLAVQLAAISYQRLMNSESIVDILLPSVLFISLLTLPTIWIGLKLGSSIGLGLHPSDKKYSFKGLAVVLTSTTLMGLLMLVLRHLLAEQLPESLPEYGFCGPVGGLLVSMSAAVGEEVWFRFGLMTLIFWLLCSAAKFSSTSSKVALLVALLTSIPFGLAHLPQLHAYGASTEFAIWATILGNVAVGTLYGWYYWRYGLLIAIMAHFVLDIVLHVLPALW